MTIFQSDIKRYVADTCAIISAFPLGFAGAPPSISSSSIDLLLEPVHSSYTNLRLIVPSMVFVEIMEKWATTEESRSRLMYEVYFPLFNADHVSIQPVSEETLDSLSYINVHLQDHDLNDRLILAAALEFEADIITSDVVIGDFLRSTSASIRALN